MTAKSTNQYRPLATLTCDMRANVPGSGKARWLSAFILSTGFQVVLLYRLAHYCSGRRGLGGIVGRLIQRINTLQSACHIHRMAQIGPGLNLPHATGIVIGAGTNIGHSVTIYQNVTIGVKNVSDTAFPKIGNDATIFAGAVIVGAVNIGNGAIVGANAVVTRDVPAGCLAVGVPAKLIERGARSR